ncbi:hypothetical protein [Nocardia sp. NPDC051463]|uniref:hypothetical protein n=1 Tax=Nocardia sp. NPDC051463 TaxID=3154845 RepID=UPI0034413921
MNSIVRLEHIAGQHESAVKHIRDQFERIDKAAQQASRELAAQEWKRQRNRAEQQRAHKKSAEMPNPVDLLDRPELLMWALQEKMTGK